MIDKKHTFKTLAEAKAIIEADTIADIEISTHDELKAFLDDICLLGWFVVGFIVLLSITLTLMR